LPLLWSLILDELIGELNENGCYIFVYANNIVILVGRKFLKTISELLQGTMNMVKQWCDGTQLFIDPHKFVISQFTRSRKSKELEQCFPIFSTLRYP
jgi:hypothetical protein